MSISEPSDGLPMLMELEAGEWHDIEIDMDTLEDGDDAGPDGEWNCYYATINGEETAEIPFWAMKPFWIFYSGLSKKSKKATLEVQYKRTIVKGKNTAEFRSE